MPVVFGIEFAPAQAQCAQDAIHIEAKDGTRIKRPHGGECGRRMRPVWRAAARARSCPGAAGSLCQGQLLHAVGPRAVQPFDLPPCPQAAGLGVHLTLDLGGQAKFGPDVQWVDGPDDLVVDASRGQMPLCRGAQILAWPA